MPTSGRPEYLVQSRTGVVVAEAGPAKATAPILEVRFNLDPGATVDSRDALCESDQARTDAAAVVFGIDHKDTDDRFDQTTVSSPVQPQSEYRSLLPTLLGNEESTRGLNRQAPKALPGGLEPGSPGPGYGFSELVEICVSYFHCFDLQSIEIIGTIHLTRYALHSRCQPPIYTYWNHPICDIGNQTLPAHQP